MGDTRVYDVVVLGFRLNAKTTPAQVLEDILGFEPAQAKALVRAYPSAIIKRTTMVHAEIAAEQLREAGARVEVVESENSRALAVAGGLGAVGVVASASGAKAQVATAAKELEPETGTFGKTPDRDVRVTPANNNAVTQAKPDAFREERTAKADRARALTLNIKGDDAPLEIETSQRDLASEKLEHAPEAKEPPQPKRERHRALTFNATTDDVQFELDQGHPAHEARSQKADVARESSVSPEMMFDQARLREMAKSLESPDLDAFFKPDASAVVEASPAAKDPLAAKFEALDALGSKLDARPGFASNAFGGGPFGLGGAQAFGAASAPEPVATKDRARPHEKPGLASTDDLFVPLAAVKDAKAQNAPNAIDKGASRISQLETKSPYAQPVNAAKDNIEVQIFKPKKTGLQKAFESTAVKLSAAVATFAVVGSLGFAAMTPKGAPKSGPVDETTAKAIEKYRGRALPNLNLALRYAPAGVRAPLSKILRERVQGAFLVEISWEDMPLDTQCFLVMQGDGKGNEREAKLRETGVVVMPPEEETDVAFKEHEEALRLAHGTSGAQKFERLCLSTNEYELMLSAQAPE